MYLSFYFVIYARGSVTCDYLASTNTTKSHLYITIYNMLLKYTNLLSSLYSHVFYVLSVDLLSLSQYTEKWIIMIHSILKGLEHYLIYWLILL